MSTKLSESQVIDILNDNRMHRAIAAHYGVGHSLISSIKRGAVHKAVYEKWQVSSRQSAKRDNR
jgi:hypothetical protein